MILSGLQYNIKWFTVLLSLQSLPDLFEYEATIYASNIDSKYGGKYQCIAVNGCGQDTKDYVATIT